MKIRLIHTWKRFWSGNGRHGVEIEFDGYPKESFFISDKQFKKLVRSFPYCNYSTKDNKVFAVLDDDRYVWCGRVTPEFTEMDFIEKHFGVEVSDAYLPDPHYEELKNPVAIEHDDLKN